ncbi:MAG TPA: glycosyltransferase family 2 protein [Pseudacidobacterium sp.]|jgi:glycosyltransferase involved in cell wall biosynthesis|nr:glycosyltransferase family 2 protein [Pseudacidobacterium sp.]
MVDISKPHVSAVIPTRFRPELVCRAVRSVLNQSYAQVEAIVIIDGPDKDTENALAAIANPRLRVIALEQNQGGAEARNIGVREARGEWIAFLDDDDEWLPEKIQTQLAVAEAATEPHPVVFSRVIARNPVVDMIWPRRLPASKEPMSEYLFCRKGFTYGDAFLQTSTFFASKTLMLEVPFPKGLKRHQDWDWLLRMSEHPGTGMHVVPEPLVIFYLEDQRSSVSRAADWEFSVNWAHNNESRITRKAYSYFIATECIPRATKSSSGFAGYLKLMKEFLFYGSPRPNSVVLFLGFWLLPEERRRKIRNTLAKWKQKVMAPAGQQA